MAGFFQRSSLSTMITRAPVVVLLLTSFSCSLAVATSSPETSSDGVTPWTSTDISTSETQPISKAETVPTTQESDSTQSTTQSDGITSTKTILNISSPNSITTDTPTTQTLGESQPPVSGTVTHESTRSNATTAITSPTAVTTLTTSQSLTATSATSLASASVASPTTTTMNPANDINSAVSTSQVDKGSAAVAGLCLAGVIILIIAINAFVFFRSKLGACTSQSGVFHVLQMSAIKKNRSNHTDVDVEARVEEDADVGDKTGSSTSLTKDSTSPVDQAPQLNGDVKVTVHDTDIEISSTAIDDGSGESNTLVENEDSKDVGPATVDSKESVEIVVPVTEEGSIENQNEEPSSK